MTLDAIIWSFLGVAAWAILLGFILLLMAACKEQDRQQSRAIEELLRKLDLDKNFMPRAANIGGKISGPETPSADARGAGCY